LYNQQANRRKLNMKIDLRWLNCFWLPLILAPDSTWSQSVIRLLAPRLTPFLSFLGIALMGHSSFYGVLSAVFIFLHTWHGIQNLSV
jgi:hypothetical protein